MAKAMCECCGYSEKHTPPSLPDSVLSRSRFLDRTDDRREQGKTVIQTTKGCLLKGENGERGKRMNGIERYDAAVRQEPPDKIPIRIGNYNMFICNYYEITIRQYVDDPALNAEVFVRFVREFGFDSVKAGLGYILYGCGPELGPEWMFIEGDFPACVKGIIDGPKDIEKVIIPGDEPGSAKDTFFKTKYKVKGEGRTIMNEHLESIQEAIMKYNKGGIEELVKKALADGVDPQKIIDEALIVAMDRIGQEFSAGNIFVAEMMVAALTMQDGLEVLKPYFPQNEADTKGTFIVGTVKGDLHDIGKNIVCMMVEGAGFKAIDLGVNVEADKFIDGVKTNKADVVGLSSLLTTSMPSMETIVARLRQEVPDVKIIVGGAPVTREYADKIGASGYGSDAVAAVDIVRRLVS